MTAESVTGIGPGSAEGPLRGYDLDNIRKVYINQSGNLLPCIYIQGPITPGGGAEKYILRATSDGQVKVSSLDQIPGYLLDKLIPGTNITFNVTPGPDQSITINATGGTVANASSIVSATVYTCPSGAVIGDAMFASGTDATVLANATSESTAPTFGFVASKPSPTTCTITYAGELGGFTGLTPGAIYFLADTNGAISTTAPNNSGNVIQPVGTARNRTTLVVNIGGIVVL